MYLDLLTKIKNAQQAKKKFMKTPFSKMDMAVAELLAKSGYLAAVAKKGRMPKRMIEVRLRYDEKSGAGAIQGMKFLSKPSRRLYTGYRDVRNIRQGYGVVVLSTPQGLMTGRDARKKKVGGQLLFEIW